MDPDLDPTPDPAIFASDLQDVNKKLLVDYYSLKVHLLNFLKIKSQKEVTKQ
jgi:hypothetical protein